MPNEIATFTARHSLEGSVRGLSPNDPLSILQAICDDAQAFVNLLNELTRSDTYEPVMPALSQLHEHLTQAERYVREEQMARVAEAGHQTHLGITLAKVPDGCTVHIGPETVRFDLPIWLFGLRIPKSLPASFHRKRPYVREIAFWDVLIRALLSEVPTYLRTLDRLAEVTFRFRTGPITLQHFLNYDTGPAIQALITNGLLWNSDPDHLDVHLKWSQVDKREEEGAKIEIRYREPGEK